MKKKAHWAAISNVVVKSGGMTLRVESDAERKLRAWKTAVKQAKEQREIFLPDGTFRNYWDGLQAIIIVYIALFVPGECR